MRRRKRSRRNPPKTFRIPSGPYIGMRDSIDPTTARPDYARVLRNVYTTDRTYTAHIRGRPGFTQGGSQTVAAEKGQWTGQLTLLDGTEYTVKITGGIIYTYNWGTDAWTAVVTRANLTSASVTLSTTTRIYCVTFADKLVISDGVNKPFTWTGASGSGGVSTLTNAAIMFGQPIVHYAKLFGIKNAERSTLIWSEENDPTIGYEAGVYNNAWTLGQTDQNQLFRLYALNEVLYAFRARSITAIYGSVTSNFSSSGTRDSVSETEGTISPASVFSVGKNVFFVNADKQPQMITPGGGVIALWDDYTISLEGIDVDQIADAEGYYEPNLDLAVLWMTEHESSLRSAALTYQMRGETQNLPVASGLFDGIDMARIGIVKNAAARPRVMHLDNDGNAYYHGVPDGALWGDNGTAITHRVSSPYLGYDAYKEKFWSRVDIGLHVRTNLTNASIYIDSPAGAGATQTIATVTTLYSRFDVAIFDTDRFSAGAIEQHIAIGLEEWGRWASWNLEHSTLNEQFGLEASSLKGNFLGEFPEAL